MAYNFECHWNSINVIHLFNAIAFLKQGVSVEM